jgi:hypothetical protein
MKNLSNLISAAGCFNLDEALRGVVELHAPEGTLIHRCQEDKKPYPCPTLQGIEKNIKTK